MRQQNSKYYRQATVIKNPVPPGTFYIPMTILDTVMDEYKAGIDIVDGEDRVYSKVLSTLNSHKEDIEKGYINFKNGNTYEGPILYGKMEGNGRQTFANNGLVYEGEFKDNHMTGTGTITWNPDINYSGEVEKGFRHGKGKYNNKKLGIVYDGDWCYGKIHGWGRMEYANGSVYEGQFVGGQRHGDGTMFYESGNRYDGLWFENSKSTTGKMFWKDSMQSYEGNWLNDQPDGLGEYIWLQNNSKNAVLTNRYHGNFKNGKRNGVGVYFYSNGSKYIGNWSENLKQGTAIFVQDDGKVLKGIFEEDRLVEKYIEENGVARVDKVMFDIDLEKNWDDANTIAEDEQGQNDKNVQDGNGENSDKTHAEGADKKKEDEADHKNGQNKVENVVDTPQKNNAGDEKNVNVPPTMLASALANGNTVGSMENTMYQPKILKNKKRNVDVNANPYLSILDVEDIYDQHPSIKVTGFPWLLKILLSKHSDILHVYNIYRKKYQPTDTCEIERGTGMRMFAFWRFLIECRLMNTTLSIPAFNRIFSKNIRNEFDLIYDHTKVNYQLGWQDILTERAKIEKEPTKKENHKMEKEDEDNFLWQNNFSDVETDYYHSPNKILLFRHFVDALVRVIYLKTDNLDNLHFKLSHLIKNHILPICNQKKIAKHIFADEEALMEKVDEVIVQYDELLDSLIDMILPNKEKLFDPLDRNYVKIKDIFKLFEIDFSPEQKEKFMLLMIIIERYHDPEEAFIQKYKKREKMKRGLDKFDKKIFKMFGAKLDFELMDFEFKEIIVLFLIKSNHMHITQKKFSKQMMDVMNDFNGKLNLLKEKNTFSVDQQGVRAYPLSSKDHDVNNINEVKERKRLDEERKKQIRKQKEQEYKERKFMKVFDYDVPHLQDEPETEEENLSEDDEKMDLGDSFYILKE